MRSANLVWISLIASVFILGCDGSRSVDPSMDADEWSAARASSASGEAPSNTTVVADSALRITVQWQDNSGSETAFEVHRSSSAEYGTFGLLTTLAANTTAHEDLYLTAATQYCYRVRAVRVTGKKPSYSEFSNTACASTPNPPPPVMPSTPAAPSNVSATPASESSITIRWQDNSTDETGFTVSRVGFNPFASVGPDVVTALSYALSQGIEYCYQVQAYHRELSADGVWRISYSTIADTACAIIPVPTTPPEGSYTISVKPAGDSFQAMTVWNGTSTRPSFRAYRSLDNGSTWTQIHVSVQYDGTFADYPPGIEPRGCYYIIAFNAAGDAPASNSACATIPMAPSDLAAAFVDDGTIELTWTDNSSVEEGYQVITYVQQGSPDNAGMSEYEGGVIAEVAANSTTARVPNMSPSPYTSVFYFVVAKKDGGRSGESNQVSATYIP
jgi:hypothetical protein